MWQEIDENTPQDTLVLLRKNFETVETPLVVIGEVVTFKNQKHHLWRGAYDGSVTLYKDEVDSEWDEKFTHWSPLD